MVDKYDGIIERYGGEEFFIILPNMPLNKAAEVIENLGKRLKTMNCTMMVKMQKITASFGVSGYPEVADNVQDLIRTADDAMYLSKTKVEI